MTGPWGHPGGPPLTPLWVGLPCLWLPELLWSSDSGQGVAGQGWVCGAVGAGLGWRRRPWGVGRGARPVSSDPVHTSCPLLSQEPGSVVQKHWKTTLFPLSGGFWFPQPFRPSPPSAPLPRNPGSRRGPPTPAVSGEKTAPTGGRGSHHHSARLRVPTDPLAQRVTPRPALGCRLCCRIVGRVVPESSPATAGGVWGPRPLSPSTASRTSWARTSTARNSKSVQGATATVELGPCRGHARVSFPPGPPSGPRTLCRHGHHAPVVFVLSVGLPNRTQDPSRPCPLHLNF